MVISVPSNSNPEKVYVVTWEGNRWHCTCRGFVINGWCSHCESVRESVRMMHTEIRGRRDSHKQTREELVI